MTRWERYAQLEEEQFDGMIASLQREIKALEKDKSEVKDFWEGFSRRGTCYADHNCEMCPCYDSGSLAICPFEGKSKKEVVKYLNENVDY